MTNGETFGGSAPNEWDQFGSSTSFEDIMNEQKDYENMERIDEKIQKDIAEDIGSKEVNIHQETAETVSDPEKEKNQAAGAETLDAVKAKYEKLAAETKEKREKYDALYIESKKVGEKRDGLEAELEAVKKELDLKRSEAFQAYDEYRAALAKEAEYAKDLMPETAPSNEEVELIIEKGNSNKGMMNKKTIMIIAAVSTAVALAIVPTIAALHNRNAQKTADEQRRVVDFTPQGQEANPEENEAEKDWKELTGVDEFDKTVDGTFDQNKDLGMNGTETKSEADPDGKFSDNSMAAPNTLMRAYFDTNMEEATLEQKALGVEMTSYKQAETAAVILTQVKAKGFEGMDYIRAVEKIKNASEEERSEYQDMLKEIFDNSEVGETSVGEIRQALKVAGQDETLADWHYYMNRATGKAEHRNVPTGSETKVLSFTYSESATTETTYYFLERCYNGFEIHKTVNTSTQETTYEVTVYEHKDNENIEQKDYENMERIDEQIKEDNAKNIGSEEVVVHKDTAEEKTEKPTGDVYEGTEPEIKQNEQAPEATPVQPTAPENDYGENRGEPSGPVQDNPEAQQQANEGEIPIEQAATPEQAAGEFGFN